VAGLEQEAHLNFLGRIAARRWLTQMLINRLEIRTLQLLHPEVMGEQIRRPLFILGLPRTGTSLLHLLFLQDPANRVLRVTEGQAPAYQPTERHVEPDPRLRQAERELRALSYLAPHFAAIHPLTVDGPQECITLFANSFRSLQFEFSYNVPSYSAWLEQQDLTDAYRYNADQRRLLQWRCPAERWVLKSPAHLFGLDSLLATFPDARIVQRHRDPLKVVASCCSLAAVLRGVTSDHVERHQIGRHFTAKWASGLDRALATRDRVGSGRFCDVHFHEVLANPLGTVRRIYAHFDLPLAAGVEARMRLALAENPRDKHGVHRYTLRQFDLDPAAESRRYAAYRERFHISVEEPA
jgi:hypothetical protein